MTDESSFVEHTACPDCGSSDANAVYSDGHTHCFACNKTTQGGRTQTQKETRVTGLVNGEVQALAKRNITEETCKKWNYRVGTFKGRKVQIANYCNAEGVPVAQKLRFPDKTFLITGDKKALGLYGQHLWRNGGKQVVITEGEIDALSVSQLQQNKWPVVSVPNGAQGAAKAIRKAIEWLEQFEKVVFLFDDDEPGREAAKECAALLTPGKAFIGRIDGFKDANEALQAGQGPKVIDAIWGAKEFRPDGLVEIDDIIDEALAEPELGLPWAFPTLTKHTYGRRWGEIIGLGAGTGIGKTDFLSQQIAFDVMELNQRVGVIYLEQRPKETAKRVAGKVAGKRFHVPDGSWTKDQLRAALDGLKGKVTFYDSFGQTDWEVVKAKIRYMAMAQGIRLFYLDHLTALADAANEKESLEQIMKELAGLANELQIIVHFVSHLTTPEGRPHEEGGRVTIRHFKGSRAVGFWSYLLIGLERDQQAEDVELRSLTIVRVLKDRYTGQATGVVFGLGYDVESGRLYERPLTKESNPFPASDSSDDGVNDF